MRSQHESGEQIVVADYLRMRDVFWFHPVNEGRRHMSSAMRLKREGLVAGVPDIVIMQEIPGAPSARGMMIEMKRRKGGSLSESQKDFMERARQEGWLTHVARGADDALRYLQSFGV